jgi:D-sedoheptulose 7-phosphate isomerase
MNFESNATELIEMLKKIDKLDFERMREIANICVDCYEKGNKILIAGNGGSFADAQHFAGELVCTFMNRNRSGLEAYVLGMNPAETYAWGNDVSFEKVLEREIDAKGKNGDVFVAISTSGNSNNLTYAAMEAKQKGMIVVGLLGRDGGELLTYCAHTYVVDGERTDRIQEVQQFIIHNWCEYIEEKLFGGEK